MEKMTHRENCAWEDWNTGSPDEGAETSTVTAQIPKILGWRAGATVKSTCAPAQVWFPASAWQLITTPNSSSRAIQHLFLTSGGTWSAHGSHTYMQTQLLQVKSK